jgi:hypothetical protein
VSGNSSSRLLGAFHYVRGIEQRERKRLLGEAVKIKGLMPLLMKPRNGQKWTREDRTELRDHMRRLSELSPYLVLVVLPGAPVTLPLLAWWLDRRRQNRKDDPRDAVSSKPPENIPS